MRLEIFFKVGYVCKIPWGGWGGRTFFSSKSNRFPLQNKNLMSGLKKLHVDRQNRCGYQMNGALIVLLCIVELVFCSKIAYVDNGNKLNDGNIFMKNLVQYK